MGDSRNKMWSRVATNFCVAVITFAIGMAADFVWPIVSTPPTPRQRALNAKAERLESNNATPEFGTLRHKILEAKARGDNTVELSALGCGWHIGSLREALSRDTVVLADLLSKKTYEDTYGLHTWYRFKIRETLLEHHDPRLAYLFQSAPADLLPIGEDEFLIEETNGQMEIEGVTVTQHSNGARYFAGQTYLLFLWIDSSKRTAIRSSTDPLGVFLVDSNENLTSYIDRPYPFKTELARRFNNSVKDLRQALKK